MHEPLETWTVTARNLPEHAGNPIHTDAGARAAGFPAALIAGVTTYAYLTRPVVAAWGPPWVAGGGAEIRFRAPVLAGDRVECTPHLDEAGWSVDARCPGHEPETRVTMRVGAGVGPPPPARTGEPLPSRRVELAGPFGADYGRRAGDDLTCYEDRGFVHPAVWPAIANRVFADELVDGPWIHTRSVIRHHGLGPIGATVDVHTVVVDRFERRGERAVADIVVELDGVVLATLEHEAIVRIAG